MYCAKYAKYLVSKQIPKEYESDALKLIEIIPSNGIIKESDEKIIGHLGVSKEKFNALIKLMRTTKLPVLKIENSCIIFDYPEKDVNHYRHFANALGNLGLFDLD